MAKPCARLLRSYWGDGVVTRLPLILSNSAIHSSPRHSRTLSSFPARHPCGGRGTESTKANNVCIQKYETSLGFPPSSFPPAPFRHSLPLCNRRWHSVRDRESTKANNVCVQKYETSLGFLPRHSLPLCNRRWHSVRDRESTKANNVCVQKYETCMLSF